MTTTTKPTAPTESPAETVTETVTVSPVFTLSDDFEQMMFDKLLVDAAEYERVNAIVASAQASDSDLLATLFETYSDNGGPIDSVQADITEADRMLSDLMSKRTELFAPILAETREATATDLAPTIARLDKVRTMVVSARNYLVAQHGEVVETILPTIKSSKRNATGGQSDTRRIRGFDYYVNGKLATLDTKAGPKSTTSAVARIIGSDVKTVQRAFFDAHGTDVADNFKDSVTFEVVVTGIGDLGSVTYTIDAIKHVDMTSADE